MHRKQHGVDQSVEFGGGSGVVHVHVEIQMLVLDALEPRQFWLALELRLEPGQRPFATPFGDGLGVSGLFDVKLLPGCRRLTVMRASLDEIVFPAIQFDSVALFERLDCDRDAGCWTGFRGEGKSLKPVALAC